MPNLTELVRDAQIFLVQDLHPAAMQFFLIMSVVGCVLCLFGGGMAYLKAMRSGGDNSEFIWPIFSAITLAIVIGLWPKIASYNGWLYQVMDKLSISVHQGVAGAYSDVLADFHKGEMSMWSWVKNPIETITGAIVILIATSGKLIIICAKFLQFFFIEFELAFAPLFLSLWSFQATRSITINFIMSTIGIFIWPLCWCLVDLGVWALAKYAATTMLVNPALGYQTLLILSIYTIIGYIFAPIVIGRALKTGGGIGAAFAGAMIAGGMLAFNLAVGVATGNPAAAADGLKGAADTGKNAGAGQGNKSTPPPQTTGGTDPLPATVPPPLSGKETAATGTATTVSANAANNGTAATLNATTTPSVSAISASGATTTMPGVPPATADPTRVASAATASGGTPAATEPARAAAAPPPLPPLPVTPVVDPVMPATNMTPPVGARVTSTAHPNTRIGQTVS